MKSKHTLSSLIRWFKPDRLIPILTMLGAGLVLILSTIGFVQLSTPDTIIIALLALISVDALWERLTILSSIESKLDHITAVHTLRSRHEKPRLDEFCANASDISILAISSLSVRTSQLTFIEGSLRRGCSIRLVLLDPDSPGLIAFNMTSKVDTAANDIRSTLAVLSELIEKQGSKGKLKIRLSKVFIPFTMFARDLYCSSGSMVVQYLNYKQDITERPHVVLTVEDHNHWFVMYRNQFEAIWSASVPFAPTSQKSGN